MKNIFARNFLIFTFILTICVFLLGYLLIFGEKQIEKYDDWIIHTHRVIIEAEELNTLIAEILASQRGYLISNDEKFLEQYETRKNSVFEQIALLTELTSNNPSQLSRLQALQQYFVDFTQKIEASVAIQPFNPQQSIVVDIKSINNFKNNVLRINDGFLAEEYALLETRVNAVENRKDQYFTSLLVGGAVTTILLMLFNGYLLRVQTKRSVAEDALSEREEIFRLAIEGTQDGVFDWNVKTNEVFYSDQFIAMLGYNRSEFKGNYEDFENLLHPEDKSKVKEYVELFLEGQLSEYSNMFRMKHKGGYWIWINARGKLLFDKDGNPLRMVGAHTDVSASKHYEEYLQEAKIKAEEANRAKSDFLAHMSHEIRTPLTTISGAAEILESNKAGLDEKKQNLIRVLNSSAISLKDLISDVLDFSKIESGEMDLEESAFDLAEACEQIISIMSVKATEKNLKFVFDYENIKGVHYYGDRVRLRQVLINLIGNAIKFTSSGHVKILVNQSNENGGQHLKIIVEDTGVGIKDDQLEYVFQRFKQADSTVSRRFGGTGLGLPISKKLAELMGGDIVVESEYGEGSKFSLSLPLRIAKENGQQKRHTLTRQNRINDKLKAAIHDNNKVLIVEDYEGNITVLSYILGDLNINHDVARTGIEAIQLWESNQYDLILMDVQMPEMDGFTATKTIRDIEKKQNLDPTPIIGMTAHALVGDKAECIEVGMDAYLAKPIDEMDFKSSILKFLKRSDKAA